MTSALIYLQVLFLLLAAAGSPALGQSLSSGRLTDPLTQRGQDCFYNMDYDCAIRNFEQVAQQHPEHPGALNHLATAVLIRELYRMGAMNTGDYANDSFIGRPRRPAANETRQRVRELLDKANQLEERALDANERDVNALYARGVTRAMRASYTGLLERSWFAALRAAVGSRHDHERVLELDPNFADAKMVVGTHDYVVGSLPWAVKVAASVVGFSGNKERGIEELRAAAKGGGEAAMDAKILLVLFLRREGRFDQALAEVRGILPRYPQNVLLALEEGNLLRAAKRDAEAEAAYRHIWDAGRAGKYAPVHYELAAVSLGDLRRSRHDHAGALGAYSLVNELASADPDVKQQANLGAGEMLDLLSKRDEAVKRYQAAIAVDSATTFAETARERLGSAYRE
jgi:tetratricopeptide (TPR) repeat protein